MRFILNIIIILIWLKSKVTCANENIHEIIDKINTTLHDNLIESTITYRLKEPKSIIKKLYRKNANFMELKDLIGFRVVVDDEEECYKAANVLGNKYYQIIQVRDYIKNPINYGYQALHIIAQLYDDILNDHKHNLEVQFRSKYMHYVAEYGAANHTKYKEIQDANTKDLNKLIMINSTNVFAAWNYANYLFKRFNWTFSELIEYENTIDVLWNNVIKEININNGTIIKD